MNFLETGKPNSKKIWTLRLVCGCNGSSFGKLAFKEGNSDESAFPLVGCKIFLL